MTDAAREVLPRYCYFTLCPSSYPNPPFLTIIVFCNVNTPELTSACLSSLVGKMRRVKMFILFSLLLLSRQNTLRHQNNEKFRYTDLKNKESVVVVVYHVPL